MPGHSTSSSDRPARAVTRRRLTLAILVAAAGMVPAAGVSWGSSPAGGPGEVFLSAHRPVLQFPAHSDHLHHHAHDDEVASDRVEGEHGLYVAFSRDSLIVGWLTADDRAGRLEVVWEGAPAAVVETGVGTAHRAAVQRPGRASSALLRYGAAGGVVHETPVHLSAPRRPPVEIRGVDTLYVVGDTHGYLDALITGLRRAGLVDESLRWSGGRRHIAFAGDLTDRGPDVMALLWLVYRLEHEAAGAGGRVHVVLGNHETMVMMGDLRYIHEKEQAVAAAHGLPYDRLLDIRNTVLGRWLASKPALIRVDRTLVVHGGVAPEFAELGMRRIDQQLAQFVAEDLFYQWAERTAGELPETLEFRVREDFFRHSRSLFWHRAYIQTDTAGDELRTALRTLGADLMVVGHTAVPAIQSRYDGAVIAAHTPRHGAEMVMLVRDGRTQRRYRIVDDSGPQPF
jgi:hypothetical protein